MWDQKVYFQHVDVPGGLITQKKAAAPAGKVLDGPSGPGPRPTAGPEPAVCGAKHAPYNFSVCAQPPQETIFIPTAKSAPLKGQ